MYWCIKSSKLIHYRKRKYTVTCKCTSRFKYLHSSMGEGENWTEVTWLWWPVSTARDAEDWAHHTLTDLSRLPEAIIVLSQLRETSVTSAECPLRVARSWPVSLDHTFKRSSSAPYRSEWNNQIKMGYSVLVFTIILAQIENMCMVIDPNGIIWNRHWLSLSPSRNN
jgi:hypothetical protein